MLSYMARIILLDFLTECLDVPGCHLHHVGPRGSGWFHEAIHAETLQYPHQEATGELLSLPVSLAALWPGLDLHLVRPARRRCTPLYHGQIQSQLRQTYHHAAFQLHWVHVVHVRCTSGQFYWSHPEDHLWAGAKRCLVVLLVDINFVLHRQPGGVSDCD